VSLCEGVLMSFFGRIEGKKIHVTDKTISTCICSESKKSFHSTVNRVGIECRRLSSYPAPRVVESSNESILNPSHSFLIQKSLETLSALHTATSQQYTHIHHVGRKSTPQPASIHRQPRPHHREAQWRKCSSSTTRRPSPSLPSGPARPEHDPRQTSDPRLRLAQKKTTTCTGK
jgi:hypothetical protein